MSDASQAAGYQPAALGTRFVAWIVDIVVMIALTIPLSIIGAIVGGAVQTIMQIIVGLLGLYIIGWGSGVSGFTPGKRSQGAMLLSSSTMQPIGGPMGLARYILSGILTGLCLLDIIMLLATKQRLSDRILGTQVYGVQSGSVTPIFPGGTPF